MEIDLIFYNGNKNKEFFVLNKGKRSYDIIIMLSKGKINAKFAQENETVTIEENEVLYMPANLEFEREVIEPIDFYQFSFRCIDSYLSQKLPRGGKLCIPKIQVASVINGLEKIQTACEKDAIYLHFLQRVLTDNYLFSQNDTNGTKVSKEINSVLQYMHEHFYEKLTLNNLASLCFLSTTGFIWKFNKEVGTSPLQYLIAIRLRHAKQLLMENDLSINQIAEKCGYENAYYFTNAFRKYTGMSPTEFRKKR